MRPEIQALRALAVTLVVAYHLDPRILPGGYVGVDVFFVISGFLITAHIERGLASDQPFSLGNFYVRRIRRLLPASLLVLSAVGIVTLAWLPQTMWNTIGRQIISSVLYVQNWTLASESVDYLAAGGDVTPIQHFWSLSAEEQFYIAWPLLLLVASTVGRRWGARRAAVIGVVAATTLASLAYSVHATNVSPSWAYFVTPTRAWELGLGGLLALTVPALRAPHWARSLLCWVGLAAILASAVGLSGSTPFPGYLALLPTLGAALVIVAGDVPGRLAPVRIARLAPVQFVGDVSYSIYLWHWPLIVLVPLVIGGPGYELPIPLRIAVAASAVPIAWLSKKYVEDPFRQGLPRLSTRTGRPARGLRPVLVAALAGMLVTAGLGGLAFGVSQTRINTAQAALAEFDAGDQSCIGAASLHPECAGTRMAGILPDPMIATRDAVEQNCQQRADRTAVLRCEYGADAPSAVTVAVVGDSHANQWMPAVLAIAERHGWRVVTYLKSGCAYAVGLGSSSCRTFDASVASELESLGPDMLITSARSGLGYGSGASDPAASAAFAAAWKPLIAGGTRVYALADTPEPGKAGLRDPLGCLASGGDCIFSESKALPHDALADAASRTGATLIDLRRSFCRDGACPTVIGGALVYRDSNHMTAVYARSLVDDLEQALVGQL